jgi:hypothetical protein
MDYGLIIITNKLKDKECRQHIYLYPVILGCASFHDKQLLSKMSWRNVQRKSFRPTKLEKQLTLIFPRCRDPIVWIIQFHFPQSRLRWNKQSCVQIILVRLGATIRIAKNVENRLMRTETPAPFVRTLQMKNHVQLAGTNHAIKVVDDNCLQ